MKNHFVKSVLVASLTLAGGAWAGDIFLIANSGVTLTPEEVCDVFLGEKQLAGSFKLVPMDNAASQADFLTEVIKVETTNYANLWTKKSFRDGINPPPVRSGDAEVIS